MDFSLKRVAKVGHLTSQDTLRLPFYETRLVCVSYAFLSNYKIQILHIAFDDLFHTQLAKLPQSRQGVSLLTYLSFSVQLSQTKSAYVVE